MRYIGIDYGTKKVGIALSDEAGTMGFPHSVLPTTSRLLQEVRALIATENVGAVVMGESRSFSGADNPVATQARIFADQLKEESGLPVFFELEMFTTQEARRSIDGAHPQHVSTSTRPRRNNAETAKTDVDAQAAALILTSYLSNHGND